MKNHCPKTQSIYLFAFYTFKAIFRYQITHLEFTLVTLVDAPDAEGKSGLNVIQSPSA